MTSKLACLGPPGTGKTTFGMSLVDEWVKSGVETTKIAYLAFTKAAAEEAGSRVSGGKFDAEHYPHFRTIHSLSFRLMHAAGVKGRVMTAGDMKRFSRDSGLTGTYAVQTNEDLADALQTLKIDKKSLWDSCRTAYMLSRISSRTVLELDRAKTEISNAVIGKMGWGDTEAYLTFVRQYEEFKKKHDLIDFTDMLEYPLRHRVEVDCRKVIVDEAQDLCPLHFAIINRLFGENPEELWMIGDDDQAIFGFSGASAEEFLAQISDAKKVVLRQTHRFGSGIVELSERIARRVRNRVTKDVIGKEGAETEISEVGGFEPSPEPAFILHRHVRGCRAIGKRFIEAGVPFMSERGRSPLTAMSHIKGYLAVNMLSDGKKIAVGAVAVLVETIIPMTWTSDDGKKPVRYLVHGAKTKAANLEAGPDMSLDDLVGGKFLTEEGAALMLGRKYDDLNHKEDLKYYAALEKNGYPLVPSGPTVTTIHGSKGREADHVIVFTESSRSCWADPDTEHRLAYVAVTRSKRKLTICREHLLDWTAMDYSYPLLRPEATEGKLIPKEATV